MFSTTEEIAGYSKEEHIKQRAKEYTPKAIAKRAIWVQDTVSYLLGQCRYVPPTTLNRGLGFTALNDLTEYIQTQLDLDEYMLYVIYANMERLVTVLHMEYNTRRYILYEIARLNKNDWSLDFDIRTSRSHRRKDSIKVKDRSTLDNRLKIAHGGMNCDDIYK